MKILLVSSSILPAKGGSSMIVENLAKNFTADEMVVLGSRKLWQKNSVPRSPNSPEFHYFFSEIYVLGRGNRYFTWFRKWRFQPLVNRIKQLISTEGIGHVIGVFPTAIYCHAACMAAKELNIPFSSYFHNTYIENTAVTDPKAPAIQQEIFDNSEYIFVMSEGMQRFYQEKYQLKKFIPLLHTFHKYPDPSTLSGIPGTAKQHYRLVAIGNFNESNIEATKRFINAIKGNPKYSLSLFTPVPKVLLQQRGLDISAIKYEGFVHPDKVQTVLQQYDICILTHGFTGGYGPIEYKTIFPTRTIPLLLANKPILVHSPKGSFLNDFIKDNQFAVLVDQPSKELIMAGLEEITTNEAYQNRLVRLSAKTSNKFYGATVVEQLKNILSRKM